MNLETAIVPTLLYDSIPGLYPHRDDQPDKLRTPEVDRRTEGRKVCVISFLEFMCVILKSKNGPSSES